MRIVIQRVRKAEVRIKQNPVASIGQGFLLFVGIGREDELADAQYLAKKTAALRVFADSSGKMNLSLKDTDAEILSVSQFTLYADTCKGNRPGFEAAAPAAQAEALWKKFNEILCREDIPVKEGVFGADMQVSLVNDGPVTILLDSKNRQQK